MDTKLLFQDAAGFQTPMLAVFAVDIAIGKDAEPLVALLTTSDAVTNAAAKVLASGEFKATLGETLLLHAPNGLKAERLLVVGLGKAKTLSVDEVRKGAGTAVRAAKPRGVREMAIAFPEDHALADEHLEYAAMHAAVAGAGGGCGAGGDGLGYLPERPERPVGADADGGCARIGEIDARRDSGGI